MVKPLFGLSSSAAPADKTEADATGDETEAAPGSSVALPDTDETKASAAVSDSHGQGGQVTGLAVLFEALTDELGKASEGTGFIAQPLFMRRGARGLSVARSGNGGADCGGGADCDAGSLCTEEKENREEGRENAG